MWHFWMLDRPAIEDILEQEALSLNVIPFIILSTVCTYQLSKY